MWGSKAMTRSKLEGSTWRSSHRRRSRSSCTGAPSRRRGSGSVRNPTVRARSSCRAPGGTTSGRKTMATSGSKVRSSSTSAPASASRRNSKKRGSRPCGPGPSEQASKKVAWPTNATRTAGTLPARMAQRVRDTDPAARVERDARRHLVAALEPVGAWVDLRASGGPAAGDPAPEGATVITGEFAGDEELAAVREAAGEGALITVFDTVEHLQSFVGLVELLDELADQHGATVVVGVPNDAVAEESDAGRPTTWGEAAFAELASALPAGHAVWHQLGVRGTVVVRAGL